MRKLIIRWTILLTLGGILLTLTIITATADPTHSKGKLVTSENGPVQGFSPNPAKSRTLTLSGTKGFVNLSTTLCTAFKWRAVDASGNPVPVKRSLNSNTATMTGDSDCEVVNEDVTSARFSLFSSATVKSYTIGTDRQTYK